MKVFTPFALGLLATFALSLGSASAAPALPGLPGLPTVPSADTARFKLIVEGRAQATRLISGEASNGICEATVSNGGLYDEATYGRGKGVTMEAIRFGKGKLSGVLITRAGRPADASFLVRGTVSRKASGSYDYHQVGPLPCIPPPFHYEFASNPDCNVSRSFSEPMALAYNSSSGEVQLKFLGLRAISPVSDCGRVPKGFGALAEPPYAWPGPTGPVKGSLPVGRIFNARKPFKVHLHTPNINETVNGAIQGGLFGTLTDRASHEAVLRIVPLRDR